MLFTYLISPIFNLINFLLLLESFMNVRLDLELKDEINESNEFSKSVFNFISTFLLIFKQTKIVSFVI